MKKIFFIIFLLVLLLEASNPIAILKTTQGIIEIELKPDIAPKAVENFITHSKNKYYDGLIFHRIIKNFMIQGGDPSGTGMKGESIWGKAFKDEFSSKALFDKAGVVAMANSGRDTNGSQFFITSTATYWLNGHHTIFAYVIKGMDVVQKLNLVPVDNMAKPLSEQKIISITIKKQVKQKLLKN